MELPETFFKKYCKKNTFFLIEGVPYKVYTNWKSCDYFEWYGKKFGVEKDEPFEKLETLYLESQKRNINFNVKSTGKVQIDPTLLELVSFAYEEVINNNKLELQKEIPVIEQLLKKDYFVWNGKFFDLSVKATGHASINGKKYRIDSKCDKDLEKFEAQYKTFLEKRVLEGTNFSDKAKLSFYKNLAINGYYDNNKGIGFENNEKGFFIYTIVSPYILYEKNNKNYYLFSQAKAGVKISKKRNGIEWEKAMVISPYMHPALPEFGKPFQKICEGTLNYNKFEKLPPAEAIKRFLSEEIRRMLQSGYQGQDSAWKPIYKHKEFEKLRVKPGSFNPKLVTNKRSS
ncbi:MAG: hypothetical protein Q8O03_03900 [Nanoarchaeota archaeon]|nr:hypothetical protein [Nanoarchaeota archaeon]